MLSYEPPDPCFHGPSWCRQRNGVPLLSDEAILLDRIGLCIHRNVRKKNTSVPSHLGRAIRAYVSQILNVTNQNSKCRSIYINTYIFKGQKRFSYPVTVKIKGRFASSALSNENPSFSLEFTRCRSTVPFHLSSIDFREYWKYGPAASRGPQPLRLDLLLLTRNIFEPINQ